MTEALEANTVLAHNPKENLLLTLAQKGSTLISSISTYTSNPASSNVVDELMPTVAVTSTLLLALNLALEQYLPAASPAFIAPLCDEIAGGFEELKKKVDEAKEKKVLEDKKLGGKPAIVGVEVLGGDEEASKLRGRLVEGKKNLAVLIEGVKLKGLREISEQNRTTDQKAELQELESRLPIIVEGLLGVQKAFATPSNSDSGEADEVSADLSKIKKDNDVPSLSEDVEDLKKIGNDSCGITSASSSVTVIDDSIEEAWVLRRNARKKTLKTTTNFFGLTVLTYNHDASSYYVEPIRTNPSDIKDMRASARGNLTDFEHQTELKKMVLALENKAQREIQRLVECRDKASSNDNIKREWEVVALQTRPRRKISAPADKKWWKREKKPLVEWVLVLRGETIDHQKRVMPFKHTDPWKARENLKNLSVEAAAVKAVVPTTVERIFMTVEEAQGKINGVLAELFKPAATLVANRKDEE